MKYTELYQEYESLLAKKDECLKLLSTLPDGYISWKRISGKEYAYLQKRIVGSVHSKYIREDDLAQVRDDLQKRHDAENELSFINEQLDKLEAAARILDIGLFRELISLRRCSLMDAMPMETREKALGFGVAMAALEGIPASEEVEESLSLWTVGQRSYRESFFQTLAKHQLI